ncbi:MAG: hypothetical protein Q7T68_15115 [Sphingopyxis sp.]|nr:hypothetical protein [Sphingopyxis sp.]
MTRKPLVSIVTSILLLPASCACGVMANDIQSVRLGTAAGEGGPLWFENLLWIGALALMLLWARQIGRLYRTDADKPAPKETME